MQIIPVIDLKGGTVVHARHGDRDNYRPIETPLASSSDPISVARGLLAVHPFRTLYIADLDAIERAGDNRAAIDGLRAALPQVRLWVDNGIADAAAARAWFDADPGDLVLGSEAQRDGALVRQLAGEARAILSLDFRGDAFQGPVALLSDPATWPHRLIVMTLARVGSGAGPDRDRLAQIRARAPGHAIHAAGGVRDPADLAALAEVGCAGVLVASALHDRRIGAADLAPYA